MSSYNNSNKMYFMKKGIIGGKRESVTLLKQVKKKSVKV